MILLESIIHFSLSALCHWHHTDLSFTWVIDFFIWVTDVIPNCPSVADPYPLFWFLSSWYNHSDACFCNRETYPHGSLIEVFTLPQMESVVVTPGDSVRMTSIVGSRKNLHCTGSTAGTSLMECWMSNLKGLPMLPTGEKHRMMGAARVKDEGRTTGSKSFFLQFFKIVLWSMTVNDCFGH